MENQDYSIQPDNYCILFKQSDNQFPITEYPDANKILDNIEREDLVGIEGPIKYHLLADKSKVGKIGEFTEDIEKAASFKNKKVAINLSKNFKFGNPQVLRVSEAEGFLNNIIYKLIYKTSILFVTC